ncbi:MAG: hypothetical protein OEQ53_13650, partial [Saprospiraceae bacterium]|nr:hypothetical protein [Saprospiraceae bacterium]
YVEAARVMAERLMVLYEEDRFRWISESFRKLLSRYPTSAETQVLQDLYDTELQRFDSNDSDALRLLAIGARPRDTALDPIEVAVLTVVINTIVNLDEAKFK